MRWGVEQRLEFIEFRLFWEGAINRADIVEFFGVSVPQASKDLTLYQERAPGNMEYDTRGKRYVAAGKFVLRFLNPDPYVYLAQLHSVAERSVASHESWIAGPPKVDVALTPKRDIDIEVLRKVLDTVRDGKSIEVFYQSMNREQIRSGAGSRLTPSAMMDSAGMRGPIAISRTSSRISSCPEFSTFGTGTSRVGQLTKTGRGTTTSTSLSDHTLT